MKNETKPKDFYFGDFIKSDTLKKIILLVPIKERWKIYLHICWEQIFGLFSKEISLVKIEFKTIFLACSNSCLSNEILLQKLFFLKKINELFGEIKVDNMRILSMPVANKGKNNKQ